MAAQKFAFISLFALTVLVASFAAHSDAMAVAWIRGYFSGTCGVMGGYATLEAQIPCVDAAYNAAGGSREELAAFDRIALVLVEEVRQRKLTDEQARLRLDKELAALEQRDRATESTESTKAQALEREASERKLASFRQSQHSADELAAIHQGFLSCGPSMLDVQVACAEAAYRQTHVAGPELTLFEDIVREPVRGVLMGATATAQASMRVNDNLSEQERNLRSGATLQEVSSHIDQFNQQMARLREEAEDAQRSCLKTALQATGGLGGATAAMGLCSVPPH